MAKQSKVRSKYKKGHRAHKRDSVVLPPAKEGQGRDARKRAKRVTLAVERSAAEAAAARLAAELGTEHELDPLPSVEAGA